MMPHVVGVTASCSSAARLLRSPLQTTTESSPAAIFASAPASVSELKNAKASATESAVISETARPWIFTPMASGRMRRPSQAEQGREDR